MRILANAHTHTTHCDGVNTPREMVEAALALGFTDLGFSGHSPAPFDPTCPGLADEEQYLAELAALKQEYAGRITILAGIEQDYCARVERAKYDYILGSVHYLTNAKGEHVAVDGTPEHLLGVRQEMFGGDGIAMAQAYYEKVVQNIHECRPDIVGHFDLLVKHNQNSRLFDEEAPAYKRIAQDALRRAAVLLNEYGGIMEINTGGMARGYREHPYPAAFLLKELAALKTRVMINSDCHNTKSMGYGFDTALAAMQEAGFTTVTVLKDGKFVDLPL